MTLTLHTDPTPLRLDETGTIRVGPTRITLDVLIADYLRGLSPEEIARQLDTLELADVHAVIAYYLRHRIEIDEYLQHRQQEADDLQKKIEANQPDRARLRAELAARLAARNGAHASTSE